MFDWFSAFKASQAKARDLWDAPEDVLDRNLPLCQLFPGNDVERTSGEDCRTVSEMMIKFLEDTAISLELD